MRLLPHEVEYRRPGGRGQGVQVRPEHGLDLAARGRSIRGWVTSVEAWLRCV
jgi:hypothetical protein